MRTHSLTREQVEALAILICSKLKGHTQLVLQLGALLLQPVQFVFVIFCKLLGFVCGHVLAIAFQVVVLIWLLGHGKVSWWVCVWSLEVCKHNVVCTSFNKTLTSFVFSRIPCDMANGILQGSHGYVYIGLQACLF